MGMFDHRRTWRYDVAATPEQCIRAFAAAFSGKGGTFAKARWAVATGARSATATYQGRKGLGAVGSIASRTAAQEAETAVGSRVSFSIDGATGDRTVCSMALTSSGRSGIGGLFGATSDARFIRPYMQAVAAELRKIDAAAAVSTR
ncbi:hypothetical protein [Trujillonella humicola]|uniref:hypothetical protein n=1 Tax=Trujillonella humicola TaxID=3383699 RepID=UPI0039063A38